MTKLCNLSGCALRTSLNEILISGQQILELDNLQSQVRVPCILYGVKDSEFSIGEWCPLKFEQGLFRL